MRLDVVGRSVASYFEGKPTFQTDACEGTSRHPRRHSNKRRREKTPFPSSSATASSCGTCYSRRVLIESVKFSSRAWSLFFHKHTKRPHSTHSPLHPQFSPAEQMGAECYTESCSDCGSADVVTDFGAGDIVCRDCGMVLGERIVDDSPEWRNFANDDRGGDPAANSRVGEAVDARLEGASLTTFLVDPVKGSKTSEGEPGKPHRRPALKDESTKLRRMEEMMRGIQRIAEAMNLPKSVVEVALDLYADAAKREISMRGPDKDGMAAAMLFIACRQTGNARSFKEFEAASGSSKKRIGKAFMTLSKTLHVEMAQATTEDYVRRFCSRLGLPTKTQTIAYDVAQKADSLGLSSGKSPIAVAASVIYLVAAYTNSKRSLQEISDVSMIGEKNMKVVCKELNKSRVTLFEGVLLA
jgi:transcription initiation factor TFIIB